MYEGKCHRVLKDNTKQINWNPVKDNTKQIKQINWNPVKDNTKQINWNPGKDCKQTDPSFCVYIFLQCLQMKAHSFL